MMFINLKEFRFFIRPGTTDLRKAINGLTIFVQNEMKYDVFSKSLFLFCNRQRKLLKIVYWDKTGFCLWQKRLEKYRFPWPETDEEAKELSYDELKMLLSGIDFFKAHKKLSFSRV
jgi:transposase